ncbi:ECF RNA polymerase sigma-E factor [Defluviimonas aquaemixtae]|uniref:RNA polymerase sigma factor n=1 Tax=Albidovulum aquaemixtae TaxID=1542388 RepID=A0A2R8BNF2_9RHOB|nr:sigma-70 family RNA polymerase sigma factor [Defluviimonas aquaemixtae]SPH24962.1 ECF RNA polymerase sigma-E factor [Defluviimonas aquaemixtae]
MTDTGTLVKRARSGDRAAFDALVTEALPKVKGVVWRMIGHPEDSEDVIQEALVKAWAGIARFDGRAAFSTWLVSIATRSAVDHLRAQKRWRRESQIAYANICASDEGLQAEVMSPMREPEFVFDAREHVAYCFVCLGRSLPPDEQAALVLRDVMELSNREAANVLGTSDSVLRHRLSAARAQMKERYRGLCALVSKTGMCHQCEGLGQAAEAVGARRAPLPDIDSLAVRMGIVRSVDPSQRRNAALHDVFFRRCKPIEDEGAGSVTPEDCIGAAPREAGGEA